MNIEKLEDKVPAVSALCGVALIVYSFFSTSLFTTLMVGLGFLFLFLAWLSANLIKTYESKEQYDKQKKVMIAMSLCVVTGFGMLIYYDMNMPKYRVAHVQKELYRVPPQLSKKQLIELGRECNTYGNTLCSHDVFAKIVKMDSRDYLSLANLAMAQSHLGFHQFAIINFKRAIQNGAKTYDTYKFYGNSLRVLKKNKEAINAYKNSLKLNPNQERVTKKIARLEQKMDEAKTVSN